jgi:dipeptidase D
VSTPAALAGLEPAGIWQRFAELTAIPRPPKEEEHARRHVLEWAGALGFESAVDAAGNVVVRVPATAGRAGAPTVVLQAHMDMVCERDPGSEYDPRAGRIRVVVEDGWVVAPETTLGADNGIGVAAALAVAEDPNVAHGPLELLFTVSEEQGLDGAKALHASLVSGRLLLNLDGTSDRALTIGCAGSTHTFTRLRLSLEPPPPESLTVRVAVSGARGGHSGGDVEKGRANAIKSLGRVLARGYEAVPLRLASFQGGVSRNAIPRDAEATIVLAREREAEFRGAAEQELAALREQFAGSDDGLALGFEPAAAILAAGEEDTRRLLDLVAALPTGVIAMSAAARGTVETSTSLTVATMDDDVVTLASMTRSASAPALDDVVAGILAAGRLAGAEVEIVPSYPPWRPDLDSRLLAASRQTFERLFEEEPVLEVVHGGLECSVIGSKLPGVQMLSIGPEIQGPHAPGERLSIPATQRFYRLLGALLDDLSA